MIGFNSGNIVLIASGIFYSVLCIFSIVTGIMYMKGNRKLNPLELSDSFVSKIKDLDAFARKMGFVTFVVGIVQGITAYAIFKAGNALNYWIALGFTLFSIASVAFKLKGIINAFPLLKLAAYLAILIVLILPSTRILFFGV
ncbi:MAG: hypothetical protein J6E46_03115 [Faecalicoccus sp.]|nr:hypothetical protein [Faecalicoccus sp.]